LETEYQEQQVTLSDYLAVLYRGRWIIAISFLVVMAATVYVTFTTQPVYEASALVMYEEQAGVGSQVFEMASFMKKETMINNQVVILKSRKLAEIVITNLMARPEADSLWILGNRQKDAMFSLRHWLISLIKKTDDREKATFDEIVDNYRKNVISVVPQRDTDVIELQVQAFSPFEAALIANTWKEAYKALDINASRGEVGEITKFLEKNLKKIIKKLEESETALKNYMQINKVAELSVQTEKLVEQAAEFEALYQAARTDLEANQKRIKYIREQLKGSQDAIIASGAMSSPVIFELEKQLMDAVGSKVAFERQLREAGFLGYEKYQNDLSGLENRVSAIREQLTKEKKKLVGKGSANLTQMSDASTLITSIVEVETEIKALTAKTAALGKIVDEYKYDLSLLPEKNMRLVELKRETMVNNQVYVMMRTKLEENKIVGAGQIGQVRIIDDAKAPGMDEPIKPKKKMNILLGLMLGLGLGVGITFAREYLDSSLKTIEDVERMGLAVLGSIPLIAPQAMEREIKINGNGEIKRLQSRLITHFAPKSPISEAYRTLRTNVLYSSADLKIKTAVVTSSGPGEGKSTSICNLAIAFAQMGTKTLIIDADLRRPVQHGIFEVKRDVGLTNVLMGNIPLDKAIKPTRIDNLFVLTSGILPPNPSELLASTAMDNFLEDAKKKYDMILLDSPPIIAVTDACVLARKVDGVILVIKSGETRGDALARARVLLENVKANLFGITVNGVDVDRMYGSYYYYYHYYYYGDSSGKKKKKRIMNPFKGKVKEHGRSV